MDKTIEYYYGIKPDSFGQIGQNYAFVSGENRYLFILYKRAEEDIDDILAVTNELLQKRIAVHTIILNKDKSVFTNVQNYHYVLLKLVTNCKEEYDLNHIYAWNKTLELHPSKSKLYRNDWANLWSAKVDYFEYQIREIGKDKKVIIQSFSYYIGLAENAIAYANHTTQKYIPSGKITLSHRRITNPNIKLNFCNPLEFIFDLSVRDLASYVKAMFFSGIDVFEELKAFLLQHPYSIYEYHMFYARLLYPSYYFDLYEAVMDEKKHEDVLLPIISQVDSYEKFLKKVLLLLQTYAPMEPVEWIIKKEL